MNKVNRQRPFGAKDKWSYAMGDLGCNMSFALNSYLMLFYTQYIGLDLGTWGIIILLLKIWDAINDPIMGALMDALKPGKRGKFKTYIYYGSFVLLFSGALCFLPIPSAPYLIKVLVCVVGYLIWDMAYTVVNVPYGAMNAAITTDPTERAQLSTYRGIGSMIANIVVLITLPLLCYDKDNNLIGSRMFIVALVLGIIGFAAFQILIKGTVERVVVSHEPQEKVKFNYFESLSAFLKNKAVVAITIASIALIIMQIGLSSANQIVFQSYFKNAKLSGILGLATMIPSLIVIPLVKPTVQRFGKREAAASPMLIGILAAAGIVFLPITPDNTGMMIYIILAVLINSSCIFFSTVVWALVADSVDYQELQTGKREEGTIYATYSLGRKLAQGVGVSIVSFLLILTGYDENLGAQQSVDVARNVLILIGLVYAVCVAAQYICLRFVYPLDKNKTLELEKKLGRSNVELIGETGDEE